MKKNIVKLRESDAKDNKSVTIPKPIVDQLDGVEHMSVTFDQNNRSVTYRPVMV